MRSETVFVDIAPQVRTQVVREQPISCHGVYSTVSTRKLVVYKI